VCDIICVRKKKLLGEDVEAEPLRGSDLCTTRAGLKHKKTFCHSYTLFLLLNAFCKVEL
jgi:hypothetical protein